IGRKHKPRPSGAPMIADVLRVYGDEVAPTKKTARNISYNITNLLKWWKGKTAADVDQDSCKGYAATKKDQGAAADLKILKASLKHWHESKKYGPLTHLPIIWKPEANEPKDRWLT